MKSQVSPVIAAVLIVLALGGLGYFLFTQASGKTFTKSEMNNSLSKGRMDIKVDPSKLPSGSN
jgi:hypothetical protein